MHSKVCRSALALLVLASTAVLGRADQLVGESNIFDLSVRYQSAFMRGESNIFSLNVSVGERMLWQKVHVQDHEFSIFLVMGSGEEVPVDRALSRPDDESRVLRIEVEDDEGRICEYSEAIHALVLVQSGFKEVSGRKVLQASHFEAESRIDFGKRSYTAFPLTSWTGVWKEFFVYGGFSGGGLDFPGSRKDLWAEVLLDMVLQPDVGNGLQSQMDVREDLISMEKICTSGMLDELGLPELNAPFLLLLNRAVMQDESSVTLEEYAVLTKTLSSVFSNSKVTGLISRTARFGPDVASRLGRWSSRLKIATGWLGVGLTGYNVYKTMSGNLVEFELMHNLASAEAKQRLELLEYLILNMPNRDPELDDAIRQVGIDFEDYEREYYKNLPRIINNALTDGLIVDLAAFGSQVAILAKGAAGKVWAKALLPWFLSWETFKLIRTQEDSGKFATVGAMLNAGLWGQSGMYRIRGEVEDEWATTGVWNGTQILEMIRAENMASYAQQFAYRKALETVANDITSLGYFWSSDYKTMVSEMETQRTKALSLFNRTREFPYLAQVREPYVPERSEDEFGWLSNLMRNTEVGQSTSVSVDFAVGSDLTGAAPLRVHLSDWSLGAQSREWDFGTLGRSSEKDPSFLVWETGSYPIRLSILDNAGAEHSVTKMISIEIDENRPTAKFEVVGASSGEAPFEVIFSDRSVGDVDSWQWHFGDGSSSSGRNPEHTYSEPGIYTVALTVGGPSGTNTDLGPNLVTVTGDTGTITVNSNSESSTYSIDGPVERFGGGVESVFSNLPVGKYTIEGSRVEFMVAPVLVEVSLGAFEKVEVNLNYTSEDLGAFSDQTLRVGNRPVEAFVLSGLIGDGGEDATFEVDLDGLYLDGTKNYVLEVEVIEKTASRAHYRPGSAWNRITVDPALKASLFAVSAKLDIVLDLPNRWFVSIPMDATGLKLDENTSVRWMEQVVSAESEFAAALISSSTMRNLEGVPVDFSSSEVRLRDPEAMPLRDWPVAGYRFFVREENGESSIPEGNAIAKGEIWLGRLNRRHATSFNEGAIPVVLLHGFASDSGFFASPDRDFLDSDYLSGFLAKTRPVYTLDFPNVGDIEKSATLLGRALASAARVHSVEKCDVISHSMGGVVTRLYKQTDGSFLARSASLGAPFEGTVYGSDAGGDYSLSGLGQVAKILAAAGVQNGFEPLSFLGGVDSEAGEQLGDPQRYLNPALWDNADVSVSGDQDFLAVVGTDSLGIEGILQFGAGLSGRLVSEELRKAIFSLDPEFVEELNARQERWIAGITKGSDGLATYESAGKREVDQVPNLFVDANHMGYNRRSGLTGSNRDIDSMFSVLEGFLNEPESVMSSLSFAPLTLSDRVKLVGDAIEERVIDLREETEEQILNAVLFFQDGEHVILAAVQPIGGKLVLSSLLEDTLIRSASESAKWVVAASGHALREYPASYIIPSTVGTSISNMAMDELVHSGLPNVVNLERSVSYSGPTGESIIINSGDEATLESVFSLALNAGNASEMRIFGEGVTGDWEPYSNSKIVVLPDPGPGVKKLFAVFRSESGETGAVVGDSIRLVPTFGVGSISLQLPVAPSLILVDEEPVSLDGEGRISELVAGRYMVRPLLDGYAFEPRSMFVTVEPGGASFVEFDGIEIDESPLILKQPESVRADPDSEVALEVLYTGVPNPTIIWQQSSDFGESWEDLDGADGVRGVATNRLTVSIGTQSAQYGPYRAYISNRSGSEASEAAMVSSGSGAGGPPVILVSPTAQETSRNRTVTLSVEATGSGLSYQWYRGEKGDVSEPVDGGSKASLVLSGLDRTSRYWARVTGASGDTTDTDAVSVSVGRLANISTRGRTEEGSNKMIAGFVLEGGDDLQLLLRVVGPTLGGFGVGGTATDPQIRLIRNLPAGEKEEVEFNDDWQSELANEKAASATRTGAFGLTDGGKDAVILTTVGPGAYTALAELGDGQPGVVLIEAYDDGGNSRVANISTRGLVGQGASIMIAGTVTEGAPRTLLVRAIGPTLGGFGVGGTLPDTTLEIVKGDAIVAENDNWGDASNVGELTATSKDLGAFDLGVGSLDSAILITLEPGAYTVKVKGKNGATGVALVEIYEVP